MKILYVSDSPTVSGAELVLLQHLDHFRRPEFDTHVFLHRANRRLAGELDRRGIPFTPTAAYGPVLLETSLDPRRLSQYVRSFVRVTRELRGVLRGQRIDLMLSVSYPASLYAAVPALSSRVPQIWHEHNIKRVHRVNRWLYRFAARSCAAVVGPSRAVTDNLARAGIPRAKLRTVYNGVDIGRFSAGAAAAAGVRRELGLAPGQPSVGLVGQLLPHKGHRSFLEAAALVRAQLPETRFFIVGALENPAYQRELQCVIESLGLSPACRFCGWREDLPAVFKALDVVTVPTLTPEPFGLVTVEAMAAGTPVVASRAGGTLEIVTDGETGLLFPPGDAAALADAMLRTLRDAELRAGLGAAGRQRVAREFTVGRHLAEMERIYREACPLSRRPESSRASS